MEIGMSKQRNGCMRMRRCQSSTPLLRQDREVDQMKELVLQFPDKVDLGPALEFISTSQKLVVSSSPFVLEKNLNSKSFHQSPTSGKTSPDNYQ